MKKFLSIALALLMVCVMLPVVALAEDGEGGSTPAATAVAKIGDTEYTSLQSAIDVGNGKVVELVANTTESITVSSGSVTLKLSAKLTNTAGQHTITVSKGATLTIEGAGTVDNVSHGCGALFNNGTVIINGGTFDRSRENGTNKDSAGNNSWYTICNHGTMTVNNATVTTASGNKDLGRYSSLFENGYQNYNKQYDESTNQEYPTLTINNGTFNGGLNTIKNDDNGIANIYGGKCTNFYQACVQNHHKTTIYNGEFTTNVSDAWSVLNCGNCTSNVAGHDEHNLTIVNGTFTGAVGITVGSAAINGGTVNGKIVKGDTATISISGGTFSDKENAKKYIPEGKTINSNGTVVDKTITIIVPGDTTPAETPKTEDQKNPSTGANDFVGLAAAAAVVALLGSAVVLRKK